MKKQVLLLIIFLGGLLQPVTLVAQISFGGIPPSFNFNDEKLQLPQYEAVVDFDVKQQLIEDAEWESLGNPPRCAKIISVK